MSEEKKTKRRDFIFTASYALGAVGVGAAVWPLLDLMNPDASVKALIRNFSFFAIRYLKSLPDSDACLHVEQLCLARY